MPKIIFPNRVAIAFDGINVKAFEANVAYDLSDKAIAILDETKTEYKTAGILGKTKNKTDDAVEDAEEVVEEVQADETEEAPKKRGRRKA